MALCWTSLLLLLSLFSTRANGVCIILSDELTNFVPACAQECFESFLKSNFPTTVCTSTPTLDCLCSSNSTSGYTVGEGAVQCIASDDRIGSCQGADAEEAVLLDAYTMCIGQENALPNTHRALTATFIRQTSMSSTLLLTPGPTTSSISTNYCSGGAAVTSSISTASSTISSRTETSTTKSSQPAQTAEATSKTTALTESQKVGVIVASVGGGALVVGTLVLFACWRRRKRARDSDMLPFQVDPSNSVKYSYQFRGPTKLGKKRKGPGETANGIAARVPPPIPPRIETQDPNMFSRRSIRPDTIGLAISPDTNEEIQRRHSSKLLPEKPILTLKLPQPSTGTVGSAFKFSQPIKQPSASTRQSTATEFEEDDDSADTAVAMEENKGSKSTDQVGTQNWSTIQPVPPFVGGGQTQFFISPSDWRPQNPSKINAAQEYEVKPLVLARPLGSFSQPRIVPIKPFPRLTQPLQLNIPSEPNNPLTASSSIYSLHSSFPRSDAGRNSNPTQRKSYDRSGSLTSFETDDSVTAPPEQEPKTAVTDLSPVIESPASGKSPVSYPKIPGRLSRDYIRTVPPPPQPDFGAVLSSQSGMKPWRVAEVNAQRERARQRETHMHAQREIPEHEQRYQRQPLQEHIAPSAAYNYLPSKAQLQHPSFLNLYQHFHPQSDPMIQNPSTNSRTSSLISENSTSSSLLTKRRGQQKAEALKLVTDNEKRRQQVKWRVLKDGDIQKAKMPGWRPQLAGGGGHVGAGMLGESELPRTPGWVPRLTPTRRGDELFLNVN